MKKFEHWFYRGIKLIKRKLKVTLIGSWQKLYIGPRDKCGAENKDDNILSQGIGMQYEGRAHRCSVECFFFSKTGGVGSATVLYLN
jgi:hypothetical protein